MTIQQTYFIFLFVVEKETQRCRHRMEIMSSAVQAERHVLKQSLTFICHLSHNLKSQNTHESKDNLDCNIFLLLSVSRFFVRLWFSSVRPHLWKCICQICINGFYRCTPIECFTLLCEEMVSKEIINREQNYKKAKHCSNGYSFCVAFTCFVDSQSAGSCWLFQTISA